MPHGHQPQDVTPKTPQNPGMGSPPATPDTMHKKRHLGGPPKAAKHKKGKKRHRRRI